MRMLSVIVATATIFTAVPALAETDGESSFTYEGRTYVYTVAQKGDAQYITGRSYPNGGSFALRVRDGKVNGTSNGNSVRFDVADAQGAINHGSAEMITMR